jgi:hypothetical protein
MSATRSLANRAGEIVVGKPLPFSVFGSANKLLLAKGRLVESEAMRLSLLAHGLYCDSSSHKEAANAGILEDTPHAPHVDPLIAWRTDYQQTIQRYRLVLNMSREEASDSVATQVIGTHDGLFIITLPRRQDGTSIAIDAGQTWVFRAFAGTKVIRFHAPIWKVSRQPFAHAYVGRPERVEQRQVRGAPRAPVCLDATLGTGGGISCVIADLSTTGARIAVRASVEFARGDRAILQTTLPLLGRMYVISFACTVASKYDAVDSQHPDIVFYGVRFGGASEVGELAVHGYVHQQLSTGVLALGDLLADAQG